MKTARVRFYNKRNLVLTVSESNIDNQSINLTESNINKQRIFNLISKVGFVYIQFIRILESNNLYNIIKAVTDGRKII